MRAKKSSGAGNSVWSSFHSKTYDDDDGDDDDDDADGDYGDDEEDDDGTKAEKVTGRRK